MSDTVIRVENLSKQYALGRGRASSGEGLRHALQDAVAAPFRWIKSSLSAPPSLQEEAIRNPKSFYALRDISFEVKRGEVLGIIGRNGAGKSTLLKILSRITEPSSGRIGIKGRVASLLEVGTGFHPELTGRENIYLNGAILGMSRAEVRNKFDEIVAFSETARFLDTPVKHYSSGMYVRLAFAVAAHLDPEILVVDEVLAVGDSEFQKKCIAKMDKKASEGRTIIFVSHNIDSIRRLCGKCIYLSQGILANYGDTNDVVAEYSGNTRDSLMPSVHRVGTGTKYIEQIRPSKTLYAGNEPKQLFFDIVSQEPCGDDVYLSFELYNENGCRLFIVSSSVVPLKIPHRSNAQVGVTLYSPWLPEGNYRIQAFLFLNGIVDSVDTGNLFRVTHELPYQGIDVSLLASQGLIVPEFAFSIQHSPMYESA